MSIPLGVNNLFDIEHNGRRSMGVTREQALGLGYPVAVVDQFEARALAMVVGAECKRRIYAVASAETQMNMASYASIISAKPQGDRTDADEAFLVGFSAALTWVQAMRDAVPVIVADGVDPASAEWPEIPPEALAVAQRF